MKPLLKVIFVLSLTIIGNLINAQEMEYNFDTITFEAPCQYLYIDSSEQNVWQIGVPRKSFLNEAFSSSNAIITDTINPYPVNNNSYFDLHIDRINMPYYPDIIFLELKHKLDTDKDKDGGYITVSYDNGNNWVNIINDTVSNVFYTPMTGFMVKNLYSTNDTLFNGEFGFSGKSESWVTTQFGWTPCVTKGQLDEHSDTMIIRFNFISDDIQTNKEGWMIDDIRLFSIAVPGKVNNIISQSIKIYPNPADQKIIIELKQSNNATKFEISTINGSLLKSGMIRNSRIIEISLSGFNSGIYLITLTANNKIIGTQRLIIR